MAESGVIQAIAGHIIRWSRVRFTIFVLAPLALLIWWFLASPAQPAKAELALLWQVLIVVPLGCLQQWHRQAHRLWQLERRAPGPWLRSALATRDSIPSGPRVRGMLALGADHLRFVPSRDRVPEVVLAPEEITAVRETACLEIDTRSLGTLWFWIAAPGTWATIVDRWRRSTRPTG